MINLETLRMCPPVTAALRQASKDYKVPNTNLRIPKGSLVIIPVYLIHNDPAYYPEPEKFDPERFTAENKQKRHPMAFIPFGILKNGILIFVNLIFEIPQVTDQEAALETVLA